jgi:hypothetical protein
MKGAFSGQFDLDFHSQKFEFPELHCFRGFRLFNLAKPDVHRLIFNSQSQKEILDLKGSGSQISVNAQSPR